MNLKPQDVLVMLKLVVAEGPSWSYNTLAVELSMSPSEVHAAVKRSIIAGLARQNGDRTIPNICNLEEFLVHGIKFVFVPDRGELTRGMPTGYAASPLKEMIVSPDELPPVWPDLEGEARGMSFSPLYRSVPMAARKDLKLYELLVLVDAIRGGRAREREIAIREILKRLGGPDG